MSEISNTEILEILKTYMNEEQSNRYIEIVPLSYNDKIKFKKRLKKIKPVIPIHNSVSILKSSSRDSIDLFTPESIQEFEHKKTNFTSVRHIIEFIYKDLSCGPSSSITP